MLSKKAKIAELFDVYEGYLYNEKIFIEMHGNVIKQVIYKPDVILAEVKKAVFEVEKLERSTNIDFETLELPEELLIEKINEAITVAMFESDFEIIDYGESKNEEQIVKSEESSITENTVDYIETYLEELGVAKNIIRWANKYKEKNKERLKGCPENVSTLIPSLEILWLGDSTILEKALVSIMLKQPLNLKGDSATGKTTLIKTLGQILHLPVYIINGSVEAKKNTFVGEYVVEGNEMVVERGQLTLAMDEDYYGGILYIDEINMLKADVLSLINPVTDGSGSFYNDVEKRNIYMHNDFYFASAMNYSTYAGTKKLNIATFDRTAAIILKTPLKKTVKELLKRHSQKINKELKKEGFREIDEFDIANISDVYMQLLASNLTTEAKSFRNMVLMLKYITTIGYTAAFTMWLDKIQSDADRAKIVGVLSQNELLNRMRVQATELI